MKHETEGSSMPPSDPVLTGSRWRAKGMPIFLSFFFHQCNKEGETSPRRVFLFFSMVRRVFAFFVVFFACFHWQGGFLPSLLCFFFVFMGEEGFSLPVCFLLCFSMAL